MSNTLSTLKFCLLFVLTSFLLVACNEDQADAVGFWKADDKNFIEISENDGVYRATVYRPSAVYSTFEKAEYPATYEDGTVSIGLPRGPLPVLYRAEDDVIVVFGDVTYSRVNAEKTRTEVDGMLRQVALDEADCEALQEQVNATRGTFESRTACEAFMTSISERKPASCRLLFTSCRSY
ncbi:hypothetical protein [Parasulfitobacter algicola]|uniref:Lipoprotein n=1 Tax=Parasulfitobacter algicola TaxID=2614809 RepID=A0ABX2IP70_9RHOB|nr:hypothetical protein [Sulfitobacter algicola]NSX54155.1 hypothetical protein [Sulfitobacter algicola]